MEFITGTQQSETGHGCNFSRPALLSPSLGQALIEAAATPHFASVLLGAARQFDCIDEVFAYQVDTGRGDVQTLLASGQRKGIAERTGNMRAAFMPPIRC